jgi:hypothetical protein
MTVLEIRNIIENRHKTFEVGAYNKASPDNPAERQDEYEEDYRW